MSRKLATIAGHLRSPVSALAAVEPAAAGPTAGPVEELVDFCAQLPPGERSVPGWQVGCWVREIITFATPEYNGNTFPLRDDTTFVVWLQTSSRCADIRLGVDHPGHPAAGPSPGRAGRPITSLKNATGPELLALSGADGWTGRCRAPSMRDEGIMGAPAAALTAVNDWYEDAYSTGLPTDQKFPELGEMRRVGNSCLEFAPSGAYVEDWRLQPGSAGLSVSLVLLNQDLEEPSGIVQFVSSGNHACFTRVHSSAFLIPECRFFNRKSRFFNRKSRFFNRK